MTLQELKDYVEKRMGEVQKTPMYHDCCKRNLFDEFLDIQNFIDSTIDEELKDLAEVAEKYNIHETTSGISRN